jgi:hypothetical protein
MNRAIGFIVAHPLNIRCVHHVPTVALLLIVGIGIAVLNSQIASAKKDSKTLYYFSM